jgi:hypothetical protein
VLKVQPDGYYLPPDIIKKYGITGRGDDRFYKFYMRAGDYLLVRSEVYDTSNDKMISRENHTTSVSPRIYGVGPQIGLPDLTRRETGNQLCVQRDDGTLEVLMAEGGVPELLAAIAEKGPLEGSVTKNQVHWERQIWKPGLPWYSESSVIKNESNLIYTAQMIKLLSWNGKVLLDEEGNPLPEPQAPTKNSEQSEETENQTTTPASSPAQGLPLSVIILIVAAAALFVGAITTLLLTRRKKA